MEKSRITNVPHRTFREGLMTTNIDAYAAEAVLGVHNSGKLFRLDFPKPRRGVGGLYYATSKVSTCGAERGLNPLFLNPKR